MAGSMVWLELTDFVTQAVCMCVSCICEGSGCIGAGAAAAGAAGSGVAGANDPWYRRAYDYWSRRLSNLPVFRTGPRGKLGSDGRFSYGAGPPGFKTGVDIGAAPGSSPTGPIVDVNVKIGGRKVSNTGVAIAPEVGGLFNGQNPNIPIPQQRRLLFGN